MKILVIEDDTDKLGRISRALRATASITDENILDCRDVITAKRRLQREKFDLLVIDIALPERAGHGTDARGGIKLLEEISDSDLYVTPSYIIGITAYEELQPDAARVFGRHNWMVVRYRRESADWEAQLIAQVNHINSAIASSAEAVAEYGCDVAVVCALRSPELYAVRKFVPWNWTEKTITGDHFTYYEGSYSAGGVKKTAVACSAPRMGIGPAAVTASKMIHQFRPRILVMTGIAGGIRGKTKLGDIIVAEECWEYGSGKISQQGDIPIQEPAPHQICLNAELRARFQQLAEDRDWLDRVKSEWQGVGLDDPLDMLLGPMASGSSVLASAEFVKSICLQHRKLLAVEMEGYGVLCAAEEAASPRPRGVVLKSVCDFADEHKDDHAQAYAAYTSARALQEFAERWT